LLERCGSKKEIKETSVFKGTHVLLLPHDVAINSQNASTWGKFARINTMESCCTSEFNGQPV